MQASLLAPETHVQRIHRPNQRLLLALLPHEEHGSEPPLQRTRTITGSKTTPETTDRVFGNRRRFHSA
eukprot:587633-Prorocentrum_minimum.AAC.1